MINLIKGNRTRAFFIECGKDDNEYDYDNQLDRATEIKYSRPNNIDDMLEMKRKQRKEFESESCFEDETDRLDWEEFCKIYYGD